MSVIIPAYRAAHTISRPVDSLLAQTRLADEILVIDDGSPDDLEAALIRYGDRVTLIADYRGGVSCLITTQLRIIELSNNLV